MSRVTMIQHINIQISNRERTREWYEKVLGAEFLDRGPELNNRQLQLRIGSAEIHTTHTPNPAPSGHFAVEIHDWEEMIANCKLRRFPYPDLVGWPFADCVFGTDWDVMPDVTKARLYGFHDVVDSQAMFVRLLRQFREERIVP